MNPNTAGWLGAAAIVIGALVRAIKVRPIDRRLLPWISIGLGIAGGLVGALLQGQTWSQALVTALAGAFAGTTAIAGHELVIESARGGRELGADDAASGAAGGGALAVLILVGVLAGACTPWQRGAVRTVLNEIENECAWRAPSTDVKWIARTCRIADGLVPVLEELVANKVAAIRAGVYAAPLAAAETGGAR